METLGQGLYRHGLRAPRNLPVPFLRMPVPENPSPEPISYDQARSFIGNGARVFLERMERASAGVNDPPRTERMRRLFAQKYERAHSLTRFYPGVEAALHHLRGEGWQLGLCTNKPIAPTRAILAHLRLTPLFATIGSRKLDSLKFGSTFLSQTS